MTTFDAADLLPAERRLLYAASAGEPCNLIDPVAEPSHAEIAEWADPEREIRGSFLAQLITDRHSNAPFRRVAVRGAIVVGDLTVNGPVTVFTLDSKYCRYDFVAITGGATFSGDAEFGGSTFSGDVSFGATFKGNAGFFGATFSGDVSFGAVFMGNAWFSGATFNGDAEFSGSTFNKGDTEFSGNAHFGGVTFNSAARFSEATFDGNAEFSWAKFNGDTNFDEVVFDRFAEFGNATFSGDAWFEGAAFGWGRFHSVMFSRTAWFVDVMFSASAEFGDATFSGKTVFSGATFCEGVWFDRTTFAELSSLSLNHVVGEVVSFRRTQFAGALDGVWAAQTVVFDEARFVEPVTIRVLCTTLSLINAELRSGATLQIRGDIDATSATFAARTTISDPGAADWNWLPGPHGRTIYGQTVPQEARVAPAERLLSVLDTRASVRSLRRATVADLELSAIDLNNCLFVGAHGLDEMRIDSACSLLATPTRIGFRRPLLFTRRDAIAEERLWRERHVTWTRASPESPPLGAATGREEGGGTSTPMFGDQSGDNDLPSATTIAGIYRALRKGREDASNEPGAADFYYGEMEMRRLARRAKTSEGGRKPSLAEHWLLTAYWAVSGYGLRAWRALASIAVVIAVATVVFATVGVQDPPGVTEKVSWVHPVSGAVAYDQVSKASFGWGDSFELAARNSLALLRNPGNTPILTPVGTATDIAVRLLVPALLALALLAIRGRTKR